MMDEIQEKRNIVQMLLNMLKQSAGDEVSKGLEPPVPTPEDLPKDAKGIEIEKVSVLPHDEGEEHSDVSPEDATSMADEVMHKGEPEEAMDEDHDGDIDAPMAAFSSLMRGKKGKK